MQLRSSASPGGDPPARDPPGGDPGEQGPAPARDAATLLFGHPARRPPPPPPPAATGQGSGGGGARGGAPTPQPQPCFYFGPSVKEAAGEDPTISYIVLQNDSLHSQLERAKRSIDRVSRERDLAVKDLDSAERTKVCLKGVLHNEAEKAEIRGKLVEAAVEHLRAHGDSSVRAARDGWIAGAVSVSTGAVLAAGLAAWNVIEAEGAPVTAGATAAAVAGAALAAYWALKPDPGPGDPVVAYESDPRVVSLKDELARSLRGSSHIHEIIDEL